MEGGGACGNNRGFEVAFAEAHRAGEAVEGDAGEVVIWEDDEGTQPAVFATIMSDLVGGFLVIDEVERGVPAAGVPKTVGNRHTAELQRDLVRLVGSGRLLGSDGDGSMAVMVDDLELSELSLF